MAEANIALSLAALCSEGVLDAEEEHNLHVDSNSDAASPVLKESLQYLGLAWKLLTIDI